MPTNHNRTQIDDNDAEGGETQAGDTWTEEEDVSNVLQDFAVDSIVHHVGKGINVK